MIIYDLNRVLIYSLNLKAMEKSVKNKHLSIEKKHN